MRFEPEAVIDPALWAAHTVWKRKENPCAAAALNTITSLSCCRFHGHDNRIVTKGLEITHDETEVHEGVQV